MSDHHAIRAQLPDRPAPPGTALSLHQPYLLQTTFAGTPDEEPGDDALTLAELLKIIWKHKWTLAVACVLAVVVAGVNTFLSRPTYRATTVLQIERPPRVVEFNNNPDQQDMDDFMSLRTQYELMRSRTVAERVIDQLHLDNSRAAAAPPSPQSAASSPDRSKVETGIASLDSFVERLASGYRKFSAPAVNDRQFLSREAVVGSFLGSLVVEPVRDSRLVRLSVDNADAALAARIANVTAQTFIEIGQERRGGSASYAKTYLEDQIKQVKAKLEESERKLNQYAQSKQILTLDEKTNVVNQTYTDYAGALAKAEQDRIKAEALYTEVSQHPESASLVLESKTVQAFKEQKAKLDLEYQQNLRIYKPEFPKMLQLKAQIGEIQKQIDAEVKTVETSLKSQFDAAQRQEQMLRDRLGQTRKQVLSNQESGIDLNLLKREVDTNRQLYDGLLQRLKQTDVTTGIASNPISVVDTARPPLFPYKPDLRANLLAGLGVGLCLGLCLIFVLEYFDDSIKSPEEVERSLGFPLMGLIPAEPPKKVAEQPLAMKVHNQPRSTIAEAYRSVRTSLQFSTSNGAPKRIVVSSTSHSEGKSTTALALAITFAQMGQKVLLIDADMRNPTVHKLLGIPNDQGLSNLLSSDGGSETLIRSSGVSELSVLTAGPPPPNPADLLMGPKLLMLLNKATELGFSQVILDGPPVLGIADTIVLANQIGDLLFVVKAASTRKSNIKGALRRLRLAGIAPRGIILTQVPRAGLPESYGYYYGQSGSEADAAARLRPQET